MTGAMLAIELLTCYMTNERMTKEQIILFELLQIAFGTRKELSLAPTDKEWSEVYMLAESQNVVGVVFGGIEKLPKHQLPNMDLLMDWLGQVEYAKTVYGEHERAIKELCVFYQKYGIRTMLLKGYGLSLNYPIPAHRPCGDIDIYLYGRIDEADDLIERELSVGVDRGNEHHSVFSMHGVTVENHRTFSDQHNHKSNLRLEKLYAYLIAKDKGVEIGDNIYTPSPTLNAIYLVRHAGEHFATNEISLRHVLDLGTFFQHGYQDIDWNIVLDVFNQENLKLFYDAIATICTKYLGFQTSSFDGYQERLEVAERVLEDIFLKKEELPKSMAGINTFGKKLKYGIQKSVRWYRNRWKYKMVYKESMLESFTVLAFNRLRN